jgi:hypothetical protein
MDVQRAMTVAAALGGRVYEIDAPTNRWVVLLDRVDGGLVCLSEDHVREFPSMADFPDAPTKTIPLSPKATGGLMSEADI